ncbi:hypothetical protein J4444_04495 [Candidatus Woesearchaeota archaeon]|nr:hypothetical protein [Candidatus Woesearchaeota archaeon]
MGILFKTYNGRHQLHLYNEVWVLKNKQQLDEILGMFPKKELIKAKITPGDDHIELELNGLIMDCKNIADLKKKFGMMVDLKEEYQKVTPQPKEKK